MVKRFERLELSRLRVREAQAKFYKLSMMAFRRGRTMDIFYASNDICHRQTAAAACQCKHLMAAVVSMN